MFNTNAIAAGSFNTNDVIRFLRAEWNPGACAGDGRFEDSWALVCGMALRYPACELAEALNVIRAYQAAGHVRGIYVGSDLRFVNAIEYMAQLALSRQTITIHREDASYRVVVHPRKAGQVYHHIQVKTSDATDALVGALTHSLANGY